MKKIITLLLILLFATKSTFSQSPNNIEKFVVVSVNDKDSILNKIKMSAPQFYNIGKGKRIEVKVCNEDSIQIRRVRCLLYYSNSGKKECMKVCRNTRCAFFFFIDYKNRLIFLSCDILRISLMYACATAN